MGNLRTFQESLDRQFPGYSCEPLQHGREAGGSVTRRPCGPFTTIIVETRNTRARRPQLAGEWLDSAFLIVPTRGSIQLNQYGRSIAMGCGEFYLMDSQAPCEIETLDRACVASIRIDRLSVLGPSVFSNRVFGTKFSGGNGLARLLLAMLSTLLNDKHDYDHSEKFAASEAVLKLLGQLILQGEDELLTLNTDRQNDHARTIQKWILANLDEPDLDVRRILEEFNISRSSLYRMFAAWGRTPRSWILQQRLLNARTRLADPGCRDQSISEICFASGFNSSAHFARSFRAQFGLSPREYREAC